MCVCVIGLVCSGKGLNLAGLRLGFGVESVNFPLQCVGLENPPGTVAFPAIFPPADSSHVLFFRHVYGKVITGISICIVVNAGKIRLC